MRDLLIITTPRTGSDLMCQWLLKIYSFGWVGEWLAPGSLSSVEEELGLSTPWSLETFVERLREEKSSRDRRIGIKIMWPAYAWTQLKDPTVEDGLYSYMQNPIIVYLSRRDKIAQAVSLYKARNLGLWQSRKELNGSDMPFRHEGITNALMDILSQDMAWRSWLSAREYDCIEICYEDFVQEPKRNIYKILNEGNILVGDFLENIEEPETKKLANHNSLELIQQYYEARPDLAFMDGELSQSLRLPPPADARNAPQN